MKFRRALLTLGVIAVSAVGMSACQGSDGGQKQAAAPAAQAARYSNVTVAAQRLKMYKSLSELAKESTVVVRATATDTSDVETVGQEFDPTPFTVTTVKVTKSFQGSTTGELLKIRQLGTAEMGKSEDVLPVIKAGQEYVFYLSPFEFLDHKPTGQYNVTGMAGEFAANADGTAARVDELSTDLPKQISEQDIVDSLKR